MGAVRGRGHASRGRPRPERWALDPEEAEEAARRYQAGESMPQLAKAYGVSVTAIDGALTRLKVEKRSAVEARTTGGNKNPLNPCRECGEGCHPNAVRSLCVKCAKLFCRTRGCEVRLPHDGRVKTQYCPACKWALRYKKKQPRLCRVCGRMGARASKRDLCNVHINHFCRVCDQPKPPARVSKLCVGCDRIRREKIWAKEGRICALCKEREIKGHTSRCQQCLHEDYVIWRYMILHMDRPCLKCGVTLARGRQVNYCPPCQRKRMDQRNRRRAAVGAHRCALCTGPLPVSRDTYCRDCTGMLARWRKQYHAGHPVARQIGKVRPRRQWQETTSGSQPDMA